MGTFGPRTVKTARFAAWIDETGPESARPVLFVHGSGLAGASWQKTLAALGAERRALVPDLLGYGRSDPAPRGSDVGADDDLDVLDRVTEDVHGPVDVVAHSYGAVLAARLALRAPERVGGLVLVEPVMFAPLRDEGDDADDVRAELARLYDDPLFLDEEFGGTEPWMQRFFDYWWGAGAWEKLPDPHRRASMRNAWKIFREVKSISASDERFDDFRPRASGRSITLVRGTSTTACARAVITHLAPRLPGASIVEIPGAGHMSPITHGAALAEIVRARLPAR